VSKGWGDCLVSFSFSFNTNKSMLQEPNHESYTLFFCLSLSLVRPRPRCRACEASKKLDRREGVGFRRNRRRGVRWEAW